MKLCPHCSRSTKTSERIEPDLKKKEKYWLITFCAKCGYNHDIEEYTDNVLSPQQEMNKYPWPENKPRWPHA
jgi:hypothetical protein